MFSNFDNENMCSVTCKRDHFMLNWNLLEIPKLTVTALKHENIGVHVHFTVRSSSLVLKAFWKLIQNVSVTD